MRDNKILKLFDVYYYNLNEESHRLHRRQYECEDQSQARRLFFSEAEPGDAYRCIREVKDNK